MQKIKFIFILLVTSNLLACPQEKATSLVIKAASGAISHHLNRQKSYLEQALQLCPQDIIVLNNLALVYEEKRQFRQALMYYKKALAIRPNFIEAWLGIGDVYQKQGQLPQALEAYLNACQTDQEIRKKIMILLKEERYRNIADNQVLNKQSLLILFDKQHQQIILTKIKKCGITHRATMTSIALFRNFHFASGSAVLKNTQEQLTEFARFLNTSQQYIEISGHTDRHLFRGKNPAESQRLNRQLSLQRANSLKQALIAQGINASRIKTKGFGSDKLLETNQNASADQKNRRVEINVY